jgi:NADH dehydrogenase (ubiquinone) 1 alpha subcomplex subunit 4
LIPLIGCVGGTIGGSVWYLGHKIKHDPQLVFQAKADPFPYLKVRQDENLKLMAVNQSFEESAKESESIDLLDILSDRYDL